MANDEINELAKELWARGDLSAGMCQSVATYLVERGWGKKNDAFAAGVASAVNKVNQINLSPPIMKPLLNETIHNRIAIERQFRNG